MRIVRIIRWGIRLVTALVVLLVVALVGVYYVLSRSVPDYDGRFVSASLSAPATIYRDKFAIPTIVGDTDTAVFFALGYAHAQDRLWQMLSNRWFIQGRLASVFGKRALPMDITMQHLGLYALAEQSLATQSTAARTAFQAYADGVNARLTEIEQKRLGRGAPELFLFPAEIDPWRPVDSLAVGKLLSFTLSSSAYDEILHAKAASVLDMDRFQDVFSFQSNFPVGVVPPAKYSKDNQAHQDKNTTPFWATFVPRPDFLGGSNAWAVDATRSITGLSFLASDPHLPLSAPTVWYLARLQINNDFVVGGTIPGAPIVLVGRNRTLGWGLTTTYLDDQDIVLEQINPNNPNQYLADNDTYLDFDTRKVRIDIKNEAPVEFAVHSTQNGPVLPIGGVHPIGDILPEGYVAALQATMLSAQDASATAIFDIMYAPSIEAALVAGQGIIAPSQNLVLAEDKIIGWKMVGAQPRRLAAHDTKGRFPALGWKAENQWYGHMLYDVNPQVINPAEGVIGSTNNKIVDRAFPLHITYTWGDTQRIQRWQDLIQRRKIHTYESMRSMQLDSISVSARSLLPLVARTLSGYRASVLMPPPDTQSNPDETRDERRKRILYALARWNGDMDEHIPEPLIFAAWMRVLQNTLITNLMGSLGDDLDRIRPLFIERVFRDVNGASIWCDMRDTEAVQETCADIAVRALDQALDDLVLLYGENDTDWYWGQAHNALHQHPTLGQVPVLSWLVNIQHTISGGDNTLQRQLTKGGMGPKQFYSVQGPGYRGIYDFFDDDQSVFIIATGQSGHPFSKHYDDQSVLWRRGEYIPIQFDLAFLQQTAKHTLHLLPSVNDK